MNHVKRLSVAGLVACSLFNLPAFAADEAAAEASPHTLTTNIGFFGQYVFRGITYTNERPAVQGGFDYAHSSGLYLGVWGTNVDKNALYGNTLEVDIYGGYLHQFTPDLSLNVGFLQFYYPDNEKIAGQSANTTELNGALGYKWFTLKYSRAVTDFFGYNTKSIGGTLGHGDTKGTDYIELNFNYKLPVQDINLVAHAGHQRVENYGDLSYSDYLIGLNKDFSVGKSEGWNAGFNYTGTNADGDLWVDAKGRKTGDDHLVLFIRRTF
ncbi:TorF family putative porin [Methylovorus sp. SPW-M1]|jgi:uncharacterized protein (TIGR02001 family)